ncbi:UBA/THIF-type NAD/FAD binding protein (plasmid) [Arthrobacter sp. FB24]|uniref:E2/UBC family protein n=1 Tax=Arthrobacter sp. (strain FB24) TaxID=290399 RepID=UPI000052783A|nr:E2/UBC family protein [Arthrobacter sp. FB24]ABK05651.1 UBA/THIF-type NAD/FAD binding protein [Arthrobacter sp. FB24]
MPFLPWWERYAGLLQSEISWLQDLGIACRIDETKRDDHQTLTMELSVPETVTGTAPLELTAVFPDFYPLVPPKVFAVDLGMPHHWNPFSNEVCLLGTPSEEWGTNGSLAQLLKDQLPAALKAGMSGDEHADWNEKPQAEPFGAYYNSYANSAMVFVDGSWTLPREAVQGPIEVRLDGPFPGPELTQRMLGGVLRVGSDTGQAHATLENQIQELLGGQLIHGRWSRLSTPVAVDDARAIWEAAEKADSSSTPDQPYGRRKIQIRGVVFPEESGPRQVSEGWLFVLRVRGEQRQNYSKKPRSGRSRPLMVSGGADEYHLLRAGRVGRSDIRARVPDLGPLATKKVALVGAGAIGSAVAVHLGRAGVGHLSLIDADVLEPGNLVRHTATLEGVGFLKAVAVARLVRMAAPYTEVMYNPAYVGGSRPHGEPDPLRQISQDLESYDLLIDASADRGTQRILALVAREVDVPYLSLEATNGAWGGLVAYIGRDSPWCQSCLEWFRYDQTIPDPAHSPSPYTQPIGCAQPTFTGAAFDLEEVSLQAARTASARLTSDDQGAKSGFDVAVLKLRDEAGERTLPTWTGYNLGRHPRCAGHS